MFERCIACENHGTKTLVIHKPGFKIKPSFYVPFCDVHRERYARRGFSSIYKDSGTTRLRLESLGWIKTGGRYYRPALEFELA